MCLGGTVFITDIESRCYGEEGRIFGGLVNIETSVFETSREGKEETETRHGRAQGATQTGREDTADAVVREKGDCSGPASSCP